MVGRKHALAALFWLFLFAMAPLAAADAMPPRFFLSDQDSLVKYWEDKKDAQIEATVPLPPLAKTVARQIQEKCSPRKYDFFAFSDSLVLALSKSRFARQLPALRKTPGRLVTLRGGLQRIQVGRVAGSGGAIWAFYLDPRSLDEFAPLEPLRSKEDFKPVRYRPTDIAKIIENTSYWEKRLCAITVRFTAAQRIPVRHATALGLDPAHWGMILHSSADGYPLLFVPASAILDSAIKSMAKGTTLHVYGRVFATVDNQQVRAAMIVDAAAKTPLTDDHPLLKPENSGPVSGGAYPRIRKNLVMPLTLKGIHKGTLPDYRKTGPRLEIALVYRGRRPLDGELQKSLPAKPATHGVLLRTDDNDLDAGVAILLPDEGGPLGKRLAHVEQGDTLILRCEIKKYAGDHYLLAIQDIIVPPIQ